MRRPYPPYVQALRKWQRGLNRASELDADPCDTSVDLRDILRAARKLAPEADADWH